MLKKVIVVMLALVMVFNLAACGSNGGQEAPAGGSDTSTSGGSESKGAVTPVDKKDLLFAIDQEPASLDPYMHTKQQGFTVGTLIFETLVKKDASGEFIPWLATEWEFVDDTTIIFKLRDDVTFHDGSKFTAEYVLFIIFRCN